MIKVLSSGLYTTIQDLGRFEYRKYGVPVSGVMDRISALLANSLLGNKSSCSVLEITYTGPVLKFLEDKTIAITGAFFSPSVDGMPIPLNIVVEIKKGSILKFGLPSIGVRAYLAIYGGFNSETVLGSSSFFNGLTSEATLSKGNVLKTNSSETIFKPRNASFKEEKDHFETTKIEVYLGPEYLNLSKLFQNKLFDREYKISKEANRMGYRLETVSEINAKEIISSPVQPGTVQLTPSGELIILMRDAQTTGGYARILQLSEKAINVLAQKKAGDSIDFELIK